MADPPPYNCKDCGLVFDSSKSLDVHLHYHKENLLSKWAQQPTSDESNNNHVKKNNRTTTVPADSSDSSNMMSPNDRYYQHHISASNSYLSPPPQHDDSGFILGGGTSFPQMTRTPTPNSCSSPSPHHSTVPTSNSSYRFHPYQQYSHAPSPDHHRNGIVSSSSPQQCEKCGFVCDSGPLLMEHLSVAHPPTPSPDLFEHREPSIKSETTSQAEILDLDSHKVHVYQPPPPPPPPPPPQEHSVSALMSWVNNIPKEERFHPQNGSNNMSSSDCYGSVSTTTVSTPDNAEMLPPQQPTTYQYDHISQLGTNSQQQISSSQLPMMVNQQAPNKILKPGNGSWKANDARRPKTYNCSACNKWFTSSGHLKRHYNTTLHKNAVKQSGAPDPATLPISSHHHPQKDPNYMSPQSPADSLDDQPPMQPPAQQQLQQQPPQQQIQQQSPQIQQQQSPQLQQQPSHHLNHHFLSSPPNLMAGPSEVTGGLLLHPTPYPEVTSPTHHNPFLPFPPTHTYPPPQHPNFQPPHVSTDLQVTTNNISGNLNLMDIHNYIVETGKRDLQAEFIPLPSFAQLQQHNTLIPIFSSFHPVVSSSDTNVGGLSPDQISSNFDAIYQSTPSPLGDSCNLDGMQSSIDTKAFGSPTSTTNNSCSDISNNIIKDVNIKKEPVCFNDSSSTGNAIIKKEFGGATIKTEPLQFSGSLSDQPSIGNINDEPVRDQSPGYVKAEDNSVSSTIVEQTPSPDVINSGTPPPAPVHKCIDCDKVFNKACYLTQHNKSFHSGVKPYKCERCGKRFPVESLHQEHIIKHAGEKPYKCEICPKQFNHKTDLRRHMCLHTGDKPYACEYCGKGFIRKDHMIKHCETHKRRPVGHTRYSKLNSKQNPVVLNSIKKEHFIQHSRMQNNPISSVTPHLTSVAVPPTHTTTITAHTLQMVM